MTLIAGAAASAIAVAAAVLAIGPPQAVPAVVHPDAAPLRRARWRHGLVRWELARLACLLAGAVIVLSVGAPYVATFVACALAPSIAMRWRAGAASASARRDTTRLLRAAEGALRSGASLPEALRRATDGFDDAARAPFVAALRTFDLGAPLDQALLAARDAVDDRRTAMALDTLAMGVTTRLSAERAGSLVGAVTDRLAFAERLDDEVRARTGGVRAQVVLLAGLVPCLALYLALTVPSLGAVLTSPLGQTVLVPVACAFEVIGVLASRRLVARAIE